MVEWSVLMQVTHRLMASEPRPKLLLLSGLTTGHMVNDFYSMVLPPLIPALIPVFGLNYFQIGLLSFCFYILSGVLQPTIGFLSDKHAIRKKIIIAGFLINGLGFIAIGFSPTFSWVMLASLLCGLGAATFHPQSTNFLSRAFPQSKGRVMGIHGWGGSIGNFLAPLVVAALVSWVGWRQGVIWLVVPGLMVAMCLWRVLEEPEEVQVSRFGTGLSRELLLVAVTFSLLSMVLRGFLTFLPTFLVEQGSTLAQAGFFTSLMLFVGLASQPLGGAVYDRVGGRTIFFVCALATGIGLWAFTHSTGSMVVVWTIVIGFFVAALFPVALAMGSDVAKGNQVGLSVGVIFGLSSTLSAFTPALMGYVADLAGLSRSFSLLIAIAFLGAVLSLTLPTKDRLVMQSSK
jgi:FSR family fosmidomycin resistance protein-like MFS transporter